MKSTRSSTFNGSRRQRASSSEKKDVDAGGEQQRGSTLRRSTRDQVAHSSTLAPANNSVAKPSSRRRGRDLPLRRSRRDESDETEQDGQTEEITRESEKTPVKSDEIKHPDTNEKVGEEHSENSEKLNEGAMMTTPVKNRKPLKSSPRSQKIATSSPKSSNSSQKAPNSAPKNQNSAPKPTDLTKKISASSRDRVLTAVSKNEKIVTVQVIVGGQRMKSRRHFQNDKKGGNASNGKTNHAPNAFVGHDGNLFYCYVCSDVGDVVCCDGCPLVYHENCLPSGSDSRQSLENDDDPWYCPDCMIRKKNKISGVEINDDRQQGSERRVRKHRCAECQQSRSDIPLSSCEGCAAYIHHPSCRVGSPGSNNSSKILCCSCRAEVALDEEEDELQREKKKQKIETLDTAENTRTGRENPDKIESSRESSRRRTRSMDEGHANTTLEITVDEESQKIDDPEGVTSSSKKKRNRDRELDSPQSLKIKVSEKKKKKKKKKKPLKEITERESVEVEHEDHSVVEEPVVQYKPRTLQGLAKATPAFFFYLSENRYKIERNLARKHRYFNRLPKGMERNELVAREAALWWIKLRPVDHRRYMNMSMRDFEQRIVEWKEEKSIRDMMNSRESEDEEDIVDNEIPETTPDDDQLTYELHDRLYLGTSVGSKPYKPEPDQSHNRVLLDLLRDMRFHPLPMLSVKRSEADSISLENSSKLTIPHFDVHGPFSTSVGDECLGCTRGWAHFCPVLKRRLPSVEHRAKLQPPLSSLLGTRVGLGLRPHMVRLEQDEEPPKVLESKDSEIFSWRDNDEVAELDKLLFVPYNTLLDPGSRADDIVQFIEETVAMKVPEPPRPSPPGKTHQTSKKSPFSRGALPTRYRKRPFESISSESNENGAQSYVNKCGRCRTIIKTDTGCVQCRRAQLVINMSKRQPSSDKADGRAGAGLLKVQTAMLGRVMMKDSTGESQSENDQAVAAAILKERWNPCVVLPPKKTLAPCESRRSSTVEHENNWDSSDEEDEDNESQEGVVNEGRLHNAAAGSNGGPNDKGESNWTKISNHNTREAELRPRAATRASASAVVSSIYDGSDILDRQSVAKKIKEEANDLHKKSLHVACCGILLALMRRDPLLLFANPVTAEGYSAVVKNPIDFGKIRVNVLAGTYQTLGAFVSDARLLCQNALAFNPPGSIYWKTAKGLFDLLAVMQKRASKWMVAIRDAHTNAWRRAPRRKKQDFIDDAMEDEEVSLRISPVDPFERLRETWPEAVDMLENSDWLRKQLAADFVRTKENETAYYGSLAVRRVAAGAEVCLAPYPDTGGVHSIASKRTYLEDEALRQMVDDRVSKIVDPVELKDISSWREEAIVRLMRRVQSRRLERRIGSENGCARCDGIGLGESMKVAMSAERFGRNKKKGEAEIPRVAPSRLDLTTGLASEQVREKILKRRNQSKEEALDSPNDACVSLRGSRIHGWGLYADQAFKKGDLVAEYVGEYVCPPLADGREKIYQEQRIQDYQFRLDDTLVIDATMNGGHGRYINHNCNPNCSTKIVPGKQPDGHLKRVLVYALRDIKPREELSYDYQFPLELDLDARIPCNCQSEMCRGFMNWDLPEKGSNSHAMRTQKRGANMRDRIRRLGRPLKK